MKIKKQYLIFIIIIVISLIMYFVINNKSKTDYKDFQTINYRLNNKNLRLLLADTPQKQERGLMNFRKLEGVDGMIFKFPDVQIRTFWNENTFMNLKVYWINKDKIIGISDLLSVEKKGPTIVSSPQPVDTVIELPNL